MHLEQDGLAEFDLFLPAALLLELAKLLESPLELTREALTVNAQSGEGFGLLAQGFGDGEGGVDFGVFGIDMVGMLGEAQREEIVLQRGNAVESPGRVGEVLDELFFEDAARFQVVEEAF